MDPDWGSEGGSDWGSEEGPDGAPDGGSEGGPEGGLEGVQKGSKWGFSGVLVLYRPQNTKPTPKRILLLTALDWKPTRRFREKLAVSLQVNGW